ncbi:MAG: glycosyltransferase family 4 protein [Candidatus Binatia bacterium]
MGTNVCFLGGARYSRPLDTTSEKKFRAMKTLGTLFVIGFSQDLQMRRFTEHARFYLLPKAPWPILRYLELFVFGQMILFWLILRRRVEIVVAQSPYEGFIAALAIRCAESLGYHARLVVEIHGDFENGLFLQREIRFPGFYRFLMGRVARYSIKQADLLRAISNSTKEQIERWAPRKRVVQFPAWTDIEAFLQNGQGAKASVPRILYAGVIAPHKGIHHLVNAFAVVAEEFPSVELTIIGKEENKRYRAALNEQVKKLGLKDRVRFMGAVSQSELARWMANSSVLVLPSLSEGLGRVIFEAMAAGTPVIGSRVGGIPELVEDGVSGFSVSPGDENALAESLRWIFSNPEKSCAMGKSGRAFVERFFSTDSYLEGFKQIFEMAQPRIEDAEHATSAV